MQQLLRKVSLPLSILLVVLWIGAFSVLTDRLGTSNLAEQERSLNLALERCIISCYALEGFYPPDLSYMEEHYGLNYNRSLFFVDYQPQAANIRPWYYVIRIPEMVDSSGSGIGIDLVAGHTLARN